MRTIAFFNNKGGVGKTALVYHISWMMASHGLRVVAVDLDPQANLTAMFLDESRLETLWPDARHVDTIAGALDPIQRGLGDLEDPHLEVAGDHLCLVPGDLMLSRFEDKLSETWPKSLDGDEAAFRVQTAFFRLIQKAGEEMDASVALLDVGPNLGAINRAALLASDQIIIPLGADLFSLQGLQNLGPTLRDWRVGWGRRVEVAMGKAMDLRLPSGDMRPAGYVVIQHGMRDNRPVLAYGKWMERIPERYRDRVLGEPLDSRIPDVAQDPYCLAQLKHYRSLMPMAMEARKPMFMLKPADGVMGAHVEAVRKCHDDFLALTQRIAQGAGLVLG